MKDIVFVTSNDNKLREAEKIVGVSLERISLELPEPQSMDQHFIMKGKLQAAYDQLKRPVMVEDAGLYFEAWNGYPGPFIKFMAETLGNQKLIDAVPADNRNVQWRVIYGFHDGNEPQYFEGIVDGTLTTELRGEGGWGFDPIFIPNGETRTYSELGEGKFNYSARRIALEKLRDYLQK